MLVVGLIDEIGGRIDAQPVLYDNDVNKDSATGLLNKKAVTEAVIDALAEADTLNDRRTLYLAVMDIDDFKNVNPLLPRSPPQLPDLPLNCERILVIKEL